MLRVLCWNDWFTVPKHELATGRFRGFIRVAEHVQLLSYRPLNKLGGHFILWKVLVRELHLEFVLILVPARPVILLFAKLLHKFWAKVFPAVAR
jgi:hypothetical protein